DREAIHGQVENYHKYNHLVRSGDYYRIASYQRNHEYDAYAVISKDKKEALLTFVQVVACPNAGPKKIKINGLEDNILYSIEGTDIKILGSTIKNVGIKMNSTWGDYQSQLVHLTAIN
ncbi:MAG: GH36 C-terminal domain-containing protein, partial [Butyrivibrio sp.]|nr:GH36 C-terminal domain-containing protein [Butyrivibrio sp.]